MNYLTKIPEDWQAILAQGNNKHAKPGEWKNKTFTLQGLKNGLTQHVIGSKDGPAFLQGKASGGVRTARAMEELYIVGIDVDDGTPSSEIDEIVRDKGVFAIRYTTHSHGKDYTEVSKEDYIKYLRANDGATIAEYLVAKKRYLAEIAEQASVAEEVMTPSGIVMRVSHPAMDKNRLIFILSKPWSVHAYDTQTEALAAWKDAYMNFAAWLGLVVDQSCTDASRLFYLPRYERGSPYEAVIHEGLAVDIFALPKSGNPRKSSGNVFLDAAAAMGVDEAPSGAILKGWAAKHADRFLIYDLIEAKSPDRLRPEKDHDSIRHIECPFEHEHTSFGGSGTFVENAGESRNGSFNVRCQHNACSSRDRLDFVCEMIRQEWFTRDDIDNQDYLVEMEEDEGETPPPPAPPPPPPPEPSRLTEVKDFRDANQILKDLADSGMTLIEAGEVIEGLARRMKDDLKSSFSKTDIIRAFNRYSADFSRRQAATVRLAKEAKEAAEREAKRKAKADAREKEAIRKKEFKAQLKAEEVKVSDRPVIYVDEKDHLESVDVALNALVKKNTKKPYIFRNAGSISRIIHDEQDLPRAETMGMEELRWELNRVVRCLTTAGEVFKEEPTTNNIVKDILANPELPFPVLEGIVTAPVFGADGLINTTPGYDPSSKVYFEPAEGLTIPTVSETPSKTELAEAIDLLMGNALVDFPFDGPNDGASERAHALCMVLQPFTRQLIEGSTPIYLIVKPTPGTGASKLVNIYSLISTGEDAIAQTETKSEEEMRKRITSALIAASPTFYLDNINYKIDSGALASAVTSSSWTDRLLNESKMVKVPVRHTWIFAGNNVTMSNEIARRCVRIRLDAKVERPELRTNFKHKNLESWVRQNRGKLIWACLTLIQNWIAQGQPEPDASKGSFEPWARVMGGVLKAAGIPGFLANDSELREDSDEEGNAIKSMIAAWWSAFRDSPTVIGGGPGDDSVYTVVSDEGIALPLNGATEDARKMSLGRYVSKLKGRIFSIQDDNGAVISLKITDAGKIKNKQRWKLQPTP